MKVRTALAGVAGTLGATALVNRALRRRARDFEPFLSGDHAVYRWRGFDVAYTEAGDPEAQDLLLFHGISAAASSHEFWAVFSSLADDYHVIAPDLPGFGHSDRPALLYSASLYVTFIRDAIADLTDESPVVIGSSLSGAYVAEATREADVRELVLICPTDTTMGDRTTWRRTLLRSPLVGQGLFNLLVSKPSIRRFHADHGYHDIANLTPAVLDYEWTTAHQPGARYAPASFVSGFLDPTADLGTVLGELDVPIDLVWGREADTTPLSEGRRLAEAADTRLIVFDDARLLPHVEHPNDFVDAVQGRIAATP